MKKVLSLLIALCVIAFGVQMVTAEEAGEKINVASLKGPTSMGLVKLIEDDKSTGA